ncbi:CRISPR-associated exonuclease Cas4 [Chitinivorax tropicus]|uniref:CRISPR-associated exonuclease Cas4 n=1 Tax=Chitinivorax tropicus TaxID=714531 RepID=A0A840MK85_9PROT|nr:CRISPR-associated protein Cas4 [Chitinivorax tropicus]MBB5016976.1 CRISPR-associated exonuclease Cas4 [Chitinivorax tropicus]
MTPDDPIPISALQHYSYCPRQCALIHQEQAFADNEHTARGNAVHRLVDTPGLETRPGLVIERALPLYSEQYGLIGKADVVEFLTDGTPYPVEYKHGPRRQRQHDDLQLAAQALCLAEMTGKPVPEGAIYHASSHRRRIVPITPVLTQAVADTTQAVRQMLQAGRLPPPANDARCKECSLNDLCQPAMIANASTLHQLRATLYDDPEP